MCNVLFSLKYVGNGITLNLNHEQLQQIGLGAKR